MAKAKRDPFELPGAVSASTLPAEPVELNYDYGWMGEAERAQAQAAAADIKRTAKRVQGELLRIARRLLDVKELSLFPERQFGEWCDTEFGIKPRKAQLMMNVARTYQDPSDLPLVVDMGNTVAMLVSQPSVAPAARAEVERQVAQGEKVRVEDAKQIIRDHKPAKENVLTVTEEVRERMAEIKDEEEVEALLTGPQEDLVNVIGRNIDRVTLGVAARTVLKERRRGINTAEDNMPVTVRVPRWAAEAAAVRLSGSEEEALTILWRQLRKALA